MSKSEINANLSVRGGLLGDHIVAKQAHEVPPGGVLADRHGCDLGGLRDRARPPNGKRRVHLRQLERPTIPLERAGRVFRRLRAVLALVLRVPGALGKEVVESGLKMAQSLLHRNAAHFVEPGILRRLLQLGQKRGGLVVADTLLLLEPRIGAQPQHVVVGKASAAERLGKNHFLLRGRVEPESVGALDFHSHSILDLCKDSKPNGGCERKGHASRAALSLPSMNAGVSRAER